MQRGRRCQARGRARPRETQSEEKLPSEEEATSQSERNTVKDQFRSIQASEEDTTSQIEEKSAEDQGTSTNTPGSPTFPTD